MTLTTTKVNGPGSIRMRPLNGSIGLTVNLTTGTTRTAWCWPSSTDLCFQMPGITSGMIGFARERVLTTFVRKNANKLILMTLWLYMSHIHLFLDETKL